jgi:hypothetical protein
MQERQEPQKITEIFVLNLSSKSFASRGTISSLNRVTKKIGLFIFHSYIFIGIQSQESKREKERARGERENKKERERE